ncbi:hypothetical protein PRZ48_010964 [Zasmidium cellare]|uniref:Uncharacterized protein n=1 Tax=Zasmidium cellare TaxID=395010 RepID=A0ABR0EAP4_ZASCE|nr:hypothetical protein PRZ48_010964 [Zasmidium cellare]
MPATNSGLTTSILPQTASPTISAPTPSSTWKSTAPHGYVGAIVGGVLGGVAILMVLGMWLLIRRHRRKQQETLAKSVSFATTEGTGTMGMRTPQCDDFENALRDDYTKADDYCPVGG